MHSTFTPFTLGPADPRLLIMFLSSLFFFSTHSNNYVPLTNSCSLSSLILMHVPFNSITKLRPHYMFHVCPSLQSISNSKLKLTYIVPPGPMENCSCPMRPVYLSLNPYHQLVLLCPSTRMFTTSRRGIIYSEQGPPNLASPGRRFAVRTSLPFGRYVRSHYTLASEPSTM